jgi:hypothetical protein
MSTITVVSHVSARSASTLNRSYSLVDATKLHVFDSRQRTITYAALAKLAKPSTIAEIAAVADTMGLKSKTPTTASVRYHLTYLVNDSLVSFK